MISLIVQSQDIKYYRYDTDFLSKEFHQNRRETLRKMMPENSLTILFSSPVRNRANDVDFQYHQNPNFYYLSGLTEPNAMLFIFKDSLTIGGVHSNECLFLQNRDYKKESWAGRRLGARGAREMFGIAAFVNEAFDTMAIPYSNFSQIFFAPFPKGNTDEKSEPADLYDLIEHLKKKCSYTAEKADHQMLSKWMTLMREIKQPEELGLMRKAITMTCDGQIEMMKFLEPGKTEYQVQAVAEYVFRLNGSEYNGYPSICGGAENSCILHYTTNRKKLETNEVLLLDLGAEYHGYTADVTRTLPVSGKFTEAQKAIYQIVYDAQEAAFKECKPGNEFKAPHNAAVQVIKQGLHQLEIIKDQKEYRRYFTHGTSHYLGLDVHDVGSRELLKPGNIITVEPGIYIPEGSPCDPKWWKIGIRIEDDILITSTGHENLSVKAPRTIEKIEEMMKMKSLFNSLK